MADPSTSSRGPGAEQAEAVPRPRQAACVALALMLGTLCLAAGAAAEAEEAKDFKLDLGPYYFNPSIVEYNGMHLATARTAYMKSIKRIWWWFNQGYLCKGADATFARVHCSKFDPWNGMFKECLWKKSVDTHGIEDPKLFVWPGRGVYAVFGRKPERTGNATTVCKPPVVFQQFLVQVITDKGAGEWNLTTPIPLSVGNMANFYEPRDTFVKEKNWMPLIFQNDLYMIHSVQPHRVFKMGPDGRAVQEHRTENKQLMSPFQGLELHGGPPAVYVDATTTATNNSYFLAIVHYFVKIEDAKHYHHYAYKMEPHPPFRICAVSREIPLVFRKSRRSLKTNDWKHQRIWKDTSHTAFISGLFINKFDQVVMSYGSSDIDARMLIMSNEELESLFDRPHQCGDSPAIAASA